MEKMKKMVPELRFPEFSGEWVETEIGRSINLLTGYPFKSEDISENVDGILLMRGINITEGEIRHSKEIDRYFCGNPDRFTKFILKEGDIVIGMDGSKVGKNSAIIDSMNSNSILIQRVARLREKKGSSLLFIYQHINSNIFHKYVDQVKTSSGIPHISTAQINEFIIASPSLPEQKKVASFLTTVDEKLQTLKKKKDLLVQYKKGMMQKIFSQELRFKDEDSNEFPNWEEKTLGEVAKFSKGKGISKADISNNGDLECIRYGELYTHYGEVINEIKSKTNLESLNLVLSEANDVIIPASGETQIDIAKASCVLKSGVALGGDLNIIKTENNGVFLSYYLNNEKKMDIAALAQGISVVHLYSSQLALLELKFPCIEEQTKIANFLSAIDEKINLCTTQIQKTEQYKKGLLQKMFV